MTIQEAHRLDLQVAEGAVPEVRTAAINPYALAETVSGRKINWSKTANIPQTLETILRTPYANLFDPVHRGPLYVGLGLDADRTPVFERPGFLDNPAASVLSDLEMPLPDLEGVRSLGELGAAIEAEDLASIAVSGATLSAADTVTLTIRMPHAHDPLAELFPGDSVKDVADVEGLNVESPGDWTPTNGRWADGGRFFDEAAEFFDPKQGALGNCGVIAAMSAVAWAKPYQIQQMSRATGASQQAFTNLIRFYKLDSGGVLDQEIEVTDAVPRNSASGQPIYARSAESGENWPGLYEKALAKLRTGHTGDKPNITKLGGSDPAIACSQFTGGKRVGHWVANLSARDLYDFVRSYSLSGRTKHPMLAATYGTSADASAKAGETVRYTSATVVGNHAYTILGWAYANGRRYIVLRNPWGVNEPTGNVLNDVWSVQDVDWRRRLTLATDDGVFALENTAFKKYFAAIWAVV